jgi:hypothetical protein
MADYNFKGFKDYIKLLEPIQDTNVSNESVSEIPAGQTETVLVQEPTLARIIDLASFRK